MVQVADLGDGSAFHLAAVAAEVVQDLFFLGDSVYELVPGADPSFEDLMAGRVPADCFDSFFPEKRIRFECRDPCVRDFASGKAQGGHIEIMLDRVDAYDKVTDIDLVVQ